MNIQLPESTCNFWVEPNIIGSVNGSDIDYYLIYEGKLYDYNYDGNSNINNNTCIEETSLIYAPEHQVYFQNLAIFSVAIIFYIIYTIIFKRFIK